MLTRRSFVSLPCAALPLLSKAPAIGLSSISAITDEIARSSQAAIEFAKQYGLHWVELRDVPGLKREYAFLDEPQLREEAKLLDSAGIHVSFLNSSLMKVAIPGIDPVSWTKMPAEKRQARMEADKVKYERRMEDLQKALRAAHILGVEKLRVFTGWRGEDPLAVLPKIAAILNPMAEVAAKEKIHLLVENEGACNVATCAELAAIMKLVPSKWVGINWDPLNGAAHKEAPYPDGYDLLPKKRVLNVQIKGRSILEGPQKLDWRAIFDALSRDGYKGQVGLETHIFGEGQIQASHDSMKEILKLVRA